MELVNVGKYTSNKVGNFLKTDSGKFYNNDGELVEVDDLTTKQEYLDMALNGDIATTTDPKYVVRGARYTGDENSTQKAPDNIVNFDHIVLEGIPANADIKKYEEVVKEQLANFDHYYNKGGDKPQLYLGEREVFSRIDQKPNGDYHIHFLVNRHAIVDKNQLENKLTTLNLNKDGEQITAINKALGFMNAKGKDKALEQTCDFNDHYIQDPLQKKINTALQQNGLSPIGAYSSYSQNKDSNVKTTAESKTVAIEVMNNGYSEEAVENVIEKLQEQKITSLDGVIIDKRLNENNKRMAELAEEMRKITAENKQLDEAQKAVNENQVLRNQNNELKTELVKKDEYIETLKTIQADEVNVLRQEKENIKSEFTQKNNALSLTVEELVKQNNDLNNDYDNVNEELEIVKEEKELAVKEQLELVKNNAELESKLEKAEEEKEFTKQVYKEVKEQNDDLKVEVKETKAINKDIMEQLAKRDNEIFEMMAIKSKLEAREKELMEQIKEQSNELNKQMEEKNRLLETLKEQQAKHIETIKAEQDKLLNLSNEVNEVKTINEQLKDNNIQLKQENNLFKTALDKVKNGYDNLTGKVKEFFKDRPEFKELFKDEMKEERAIIKELKDLPKTADELDNFVKQSSGKTVEPKTEEKKKLNVYGEVDKEKMRLDETKKGETDKPKNDLDNPENKNKFKPK